MDDSQIIDLFFERSEQAIIELSKKYGKTCGKIAENILNDRLDSEECLNDAYLGVWNSIPPRKPDCLSGYVFRIVRNLAVKKYHEKTAQKRNSYYDAALDELEDCFPSAASVEEEAEAKEVASIIDGFLGSLDSTNRILFIRRYWYSDSVEDLADRFQISKNGVSVRLSRIRKALKKHLTKGGVSL